MKGYDAVIVGARCAGSALGIALGRAGADVALIDRDTFPSDTLSTHLLFPNTLDVLERLGVLERIRSRHDLPLLEHRLCMLGYEIGGPYTPIGDYDRAASPRRTILDKAMVDTALDSGATSRFGERVVALIGGGTADDPVRGVVLESGERIEARWVLGADGRASVVARSLGLDRRRRLAGEMTTVFAYWRGLPPTPYAHLDVSGRQALNWAPCEDGTHLLGVSREPPFGRGSKAARERSYLEGLRRFGRTFDVGWLDSAERISEVRVAPETMMRGFYRRAAGPGWALVGDAGHFKHPATAQGISDAVEQGLYVAGALEKGDGGLTRYEAWRDERAAEHYEWSFQWGRWPRPEVTEPVFAGLAGDAKAGQDLRDSFSRMVRPSAVITKERLARWFGRAQPASA